MRVLCKGMMTLARHVQSISGLLPGAKVVPAVPNRGFSIGRSDLTFLDDFDEPLPADILDAFEADNIFPR